MADEIIQELWRVKDDIAREHEYDLDALVAYLRGKECAGNYHVTSSQAIKETQDVGAGLAATDHQAG
jgi:hypothetical protein